MNRFTGSVAIITGGSRGIGFASARRLASEGAAVAIVSTTLEGAQAAAQAIATETGAVVRGYACDVSNHAACQETVAAILADFGKVDILVNNAGVTRDGLLMRMSEEDWDKVIDVNLKGAYNMSKAVLRPMMKARSGRIICTSSVVGISGNGGQTNYAASKAGLIGFVKALAKEIASRNIAVNAVAPGFIATDMSAAIPAEAQQALLKTIPMARMGEPEDVAGVIAFLAGPDAAYITGQVLTVDGGLCM